MAELYYLTPVPSHVSSPEVIDPVHQFTSDAGYSVRRSKASRPRRRWTLDYLGRTSEEVRTFRDFFQRKRLSAFDLSFIHPTAVDVVTVRNTTPVQVIGAHGMVAGQWVFMTATPNSSLNGGFFQVTPFAYNGLSLTGTTGAGIEGVGLMQVYVPHAIGVFREDTWALPTTLVGPDQLAYAPGGFRAGYYSFSVTIEEIF